MPELKHFNLPDVGEGLTEGEILKWFVQPGDTVVVNQTIVEIETAKAAVELPSPYAGVVTKLHADEGTTVDVGRPIITFDVDPDGEPVAVPSSEAPASPAAMRDDLVPDIPRPTEDEPVEPGLIGGPAPGGRTSVLVGYGPKTTSAVRRLRKGAPATPVSEPDQGIAGTGSDSGAQTGGGRVSVLAKPPVRKLAKDLGVDLASVEPTGPNGSISREDVQAAAGGSGLAGEAGSAGSTFDPATRERRIPVKGVRKMTAQAMVTSAFTAPHVTEFLTVDVTRMMRFVARLNRTGQLGEIRVSPLLIVAKALLLAVRRHPGLNASWDEAAQEIVVKDYVNLGIAAATPRGLIVPNIKDAGSLTLPELAAALGALTATARAGRTAPADMSGGTITITNVGVFGVDAGTPILNPGEAAILCFGAVREMPWVHLGKIRKRMVTQLSLSFDHRMVDGELGSRFLADLASVLHDPANAILFS